MCDLPKDTQTVVPGFALKCQLQPSEYEKFSNLIAFVSMFPTDCIASTVLVAKSTGSFDVNVESMFPHPFLSQGQ